MSFISALYHLSVKFRCFDHCIARGNDYYGWIWGTHCACGDDIPKEAHKKKESLCYMACPGDPEAKCGGNVNRMNVYHIGSPNYASASGELF